MAAGEVKLFDGVLTVDFDPGANVRRQFTKEGLFVMQTGNQATPEAKDYKRSTDVFIVDTKFKDRFTDYENLWDMVKNLPNATDGKFTFTWNTETFTVVVKTLLAEKDSGDGTMMDIHCEMEIVQA